MRVPRLTGYEPRILEFKFTETDKHEVSQSGFIWTSALTTNSLILQPGIWLLWINADVEDLGFTDLDLGLGIHTANGTGNATTPAQIDDSRYLSHGYPDEEFFRINFQLPGAAGGSLQWIIHLKEEDEIFANVGVRTNAANALQIQLGFSAMRIR